MGLCQLDDAAHIFERLQDGVTTRTVDARINLGNFNCTRQQNILPVQTAHRQRKTRLRTAEPTYNTCCLGHILE